MEEKLKTGTTTVGVVCSDGVILAAERKVTAGYQISHKHFKKIFQIQPHIGMTVAGSVSDAQAVIRVMKAETSLWQQARKRPIEVEAVGTLLANILHYSGAFVGHILGGYDTKPSIYAIEGDGSLVQYDDYTSIGSGESYALGALEDNWERGKTISETVPLIARAIRSAIERDIGSGGTGVDMLAIHKNKSEWIDEKIYESLLRRKV